MVGSSMLALMLAAQIPPVVPAGFPQPADARPLAAAHAPADPLASDAMRGDARLSDVCFVDRRHGWAVGDRGVIWHTDDGGTHWHVQHSGVSCRLESVWFIDERTGWAAGGYSHPYTHTSSAVLLSTRDGGRHWQQHAHLPLPALKQVRFFNEKQGWALGNASAMVPSGVLVTDNGGRSWRPLSGGSAAHWLGGDFLDPHTGTLAGRQGTVAMVQRGGIEPARTGSFGLRNLRRMKLVAPVYGWLIGDGGLVMMTDDLGATWQTPPGPLPADVARQFDFAALAVRGPKCWIAGTPGTRVFHSPDAGRTWTTFATGTHLPIHALSFADDQHGWAVGALGTILATDDGGRTWRRQRSGGTRAALLGLFASADEVPLELFARLSGNDGYLGVVEVLNRRDLEVKLRDESHPVDRLREALVAVGASDAQAAWKFPLRQAGLELPADRIIGAWDQANDGRGMEELQAHLVKSIRLWRPEVIVTHDASPTGDDPLAHLIHRLVLQAVEEAADETRFPRQIALAGLPPWNVKKVYGTLPEGSRGPTELSTAQLATRLGRSLADVAAAPRGLLEDRYTATPQMLGFRLLVQHLSQTPDRDDFFTGVVLYPGGDARRELIEPPAEGIERLHRAALRGRNAQAIIEQAKNDSPGADRLLAQAGELARDLEGDTAGRVLYHLAEQYRRHGRWRMAAETFEMLAERYPDHPTTPAALLWLVQYYAGGETAWRVEGFQRYAGGQATWRMQDGRQRYAVRQASALAVDPARQENRYQRAAQFARQIERTRPALFAEPALRFPLAVAHRNQGFPQQAERYYLARSRSSRQDAWWACAQGEKWLAEAKGVPPKPLLGCAAAASKPRLDGRFDDAVWQQAKPAELHSTLGDDGQWPAAVMLAYDQEFLYLAVRCRRVPGAKYESTPGPRPRDPDLTGHDRVDVFLDLDRDFATYYRLSIDHRGWVAEGCWGDATWDPTWFVAAAADHGEWTAEAAIPLDQLTGRLPRSRSVWAVGIQRTVPGVGFQSWTQPAGTEVVPEGFGYLVFD